MARRTFHGDWSAFYRIPIDDDINGRVEVLLGVYALRGADAVHLASALLLRELLQEEVTFACADLALLEAARVEGLNLAP